MIYIHNFRAGFATNSSSSHSVVILPENAKGATDILSYDSPAAFGWEHFRLVTEEQKLRYLAAQLFCSFRNENEKYFEALEPIWNAVDGLKEEFEKSIKKDDGYCYDVYVDHESVIGLDTSKESIENMIAFFQSENVAVYGGNDNDDPGFNHPIPGSVEIDCLQNISKGCEDDYKNIFKKENNKWVVFNKETGNKVRFSLTKDEKPSLWKKSETPELVDVKITNYCDRGCNFCYQSSTTEGLHADFDLILDYFSMLSEMKVFEVAIGGGEPTQHPEFAQILHAAKQMNITPNFTTFSDEWLQNPEILEAVMQCVGGIGVSCHDAKGLKLVKNIKEILNPYGWDPRPRVMAQHVLGSVPLDVTAKFIVEAFKEEIPVLLLGYKEVGFGKNYKRHDNSSVSTILKAAVESVYLSKVSLSVDTALVDTYPDLIEALGAPEALVTSPEGKFSCYIDAVEQKMGPSSYVEAHEMTEMPESVEDFKNIFSTY